MLLQLSIPRINLEISRFDAAHIHVNISTLHVSMPDNNVLVTIFFKLLLLSGFMSFRSFTFRPKILVTFKQKRCLDNTIVDYNNMGSSVSKIKILSIYSDWSSFRQIVGHFYTWQLFSICYHTFEIR